jgi:hypothetical protein
MGYQKNISDQSIFLAHNIIAISDTVGPERIYLNKRSPKNEFSIHFLWYKILTKKIGWYLY